VSIEKPPIEKAPLLYVRSATRNAADLWEILFLKHSPHHDFIACCDSQDELRDCLDTVSEPVNLVVTGQYDMVLALQSDKNWFREKVARVFVIGGQAEGYIPIDPRLKERHPEFFAPSPIENPRALSQLLTSGEAIIWLPRDICLWRYAAPQILEETENPAIRQALEVLAAETGNDNDPVLLSALPAFCLAYQPDITLWLRLFRTVPARLACDENGAITIFDTKADSPNLYVVTAIDGTALSKQMTSVLRGTLKT
jgi:hypothetical protein